MNIDYKKILNINNKKKLHKFNLDKPIFKNNYLFHYLIILNNLKALKLYKFPIYIENEDNLNGFNLAAKHNNMNILFYLLKYYSDYIYNINSDNKLFTNYLKYNNFNILLEKYDYLDWDLLLNFDIINNIFINNNYNYLLKFIKLYKNKFNLIGIINNNLINQEEKIILLDKFYNDIINLKDINNKGLLIYTIELNNKIIFKYLLNKNIDINYFDNNSYSPLFYSITNDINNNKYYYTKLLLKKLIIHDPLFYKTYNKYFNNMIHILLLLRIEYNKKLNKNINYNIDLNILKYCDSESWNFNNYENISSLELLVQLDYNIYSNIIINNNICISKNNLNILNNYKLINNNWLKLYNKLSILNINNNDNINLYKNNDNDNIISLSSNIIDILIYNIYLLKKYDNLFIPIINDTFNINYIKTNNFIKLPCFILFKNKNNYFIHPYLNHIINNNNNKNYILLYINIQTEILSHCNILIYDLKKKIIERFEPYGNEFISDIDNILEEELCWNTNFTYISPKSYLPLNSFQNISDESNNNDVINGDLEGYCVYWCLWYIENKLLNSTIESKVLVDKLILKLKKLNISFKTYIRNYSFSISKIKNKYMKKINKLKLNIYNNYYKIIKYFIN